MAWGRDHEDVSTYLKRILWSEAALPPTHAHPAYLSWWSEGEPVLMWFVLLYPSVLGQATPQGLVLRIKQVLVWFSQAPSMEQIVSWNGGIIMRAVWKPRGRGTNLLRFRPGWASGIFIINIPLSCHSSSTSKTNSNLDVSLCELTSFLKYKALSNSSYSTAV